MQKDFRNTVVGLYINIHACNKVSSMMKPLLEKLIRENKEVKLLGDFNIDLQKCYSNKNFSDFFNIIYRIIFFLTLLLLLDEQVEVKP